MGHLRTQQQNYKSTKTSIIPQQNDLDISPSQEKDNPLTNTMYTNFVSTHTMHKNYSDQTGKFIIQSSRGNNYIFILYNYDSKSILSIPIKNRQTKSIADAWKLCYIRLKNNGHAPDLHILDNECSDLLKSSFNKHNINFQQVPPHTHLRNAAKRDIQTWKNHFLSVLTTCDPDYPATEWDRLMPQYDMTINLLHYSCRQLNLSAHASLFGNHDFNRNPLAPPQNQSSGPQNNRSTQKLGTTWHHQLVHWTLHRTLPMPQMLHPNNQQSA